MLHSCKYENKNTWKNIEKSVVSIYAFFNSNNKLEVLLKNQIKCYVEFANDLFYSENKQ